MVIGVGNPDRGDDGAGPAVARLVEAAGARGVAAVVRRSDPTAVIEDWAEAETVYLIDACRSGGAPGTVRRFDVGDGPLAHRPGRYSTHGFDVAEAIELARAVGRLPRRLIVFTIDGQDFGLGTGVSPPVDAATRSVADRIIDETHRAV
jgi:hydrogenase maturation protease